MSPSSNRSRFLVKVVGAHTRSSMPRPTNQRNSRLYSSCSISIRSLRTEYSTWISNARNRCSGGIDLSIRSRTVFQHPAKRYEGIPRAHLETDSIEAEYRPIDHVG